MGERKRLLIVFHTQSGNTGRLADAVLKGAQRVTEVDTVMKRAFDAGTEDLLACHGLLLGTPENFGYMSGMPKDFFDRTFYVVENQVFRKPYVVFISAGNDGTGALRAIERIALGYKFKKVYEPVIAKGDIEPVDLEKCRELGGVLSGGCQMGIY